MNFCKKCRITPVKDGQKYCSKCIAERTAKRRKLIISVGTAVITIGIFVVKQAPKVALSIITKGKYKSK